MSSSAVMCSTLPCAITNVCWATLFWKAVLLQTKLVLLLLEFSFKEPKWLNDISEVKFSSRACSCVVFPIVSCHSFFFQTSKRSACYVPCEQIKPKTSQIYAYFFFQQTYSVKGLRITGLNIKTYKIWFCVFHTYRVGKKCSNQAKCDNGNLHSVKDKKWVINTFTYCNQ